MTTKYVPVQQRISADWLGMRSAAQRIGVSPTRMYQLAREGAIPGILTEIGWLFSPAEVDAYAKRRVNSPRIGRGYLVGPAEQNEVQE